ncbi:MAG: hypothetical protein V4812_09460 [Pseudomonadota bacterium]
MASAPVSRTRVFAFLRANGALLACAALVLTVVLLIRLTLGFEFPIPWNDETAFIAQAFEFSRSGSFFVWGLNQERLVMWMPPGYMLLLAGVYKLFGYSFEISRWVSCVLYLGVFGIALTLVRGCLQGWRQRLALGLMLLAFLSPYALAISNIARMEALYGLIFFASLLAALRGKPALGLALVLLGATVHYNAVYFLLPYGGLVLWTLVRRESLRIGPGELLALVVAMLALAGYGLFVIKHIDGFWQDMRFQFDFKLGAPLMGGRPGWTLLLGLLAIPIIQLLTHRRFGAEAWLSLYGVAFVALALNGHSMWYYFAYGFGFWLLLLGVLVSSAAVGKAHWRMAWALLALGLAVPLGYYTSRSTPEFDPLKPRLSSLSRDFLAGRELQRVRDFIQALPADSTVSFGYSGVEPYFFDDLANAKVRWSIPGHSVIQVFPARSLDYRVLCDSALFPPYLFVYDWDGYPRKGQDSGCTVIPLNPAATPAASAPRS